VATRSGEGGRRAQRRTGSETTAVVLDAALATFAEDGVDRATLPRVAERAGTSIGPLYTRFDGTDDLVGALWGPQLRPTLERLLDQLTA
jgi:AcrR family transcriptional regulator